MIRPAGPGTSPQVVSLHPPVIETHVVIARHRGRCMQPHGCRGPIRVDEAIVLVSGRWLHEECVPGDAIEQIPERREAA